MFPMESPHKSATVRAEVRTAVTSPPAAVSWALIFARFLSEQVNVRWV